MRNLPPASPTPSSAGTENVPGRAAPKLAGGPGAGGSSSHPAGLSRILIENLLDAVHVADADGRIIYVAPAMETVLGYTAEQLGGRAASEYVHPDDVEQAEMAFREDIARPGASRRIELRVRHADGSWRFLEMVGKSAVDASGSPILIVTSRDVTDRRRAEEALRASEERYRRFFEDDLTGDFVATPEGKLLACNSAFAEILGFDSIEEALSVRSEAFYPDPRLREGFLERLRQEKVLKHLELELRSRDGSPVYVVENVIGTFDGEGALVELRGYLFDITQQKRLADERTQLLVRERAARALAEAAERRTAFLAEVGNALDASLDYRITLTKLAHLLVPTLADYCLIDEATADGGSRRVAAVHVDPRMQQVLMPDVQNPPEADLGQHPVMRVLRTGEPVLVSEMSQEVLDAIAHDAEHREALARIGLVSFIIVPLTARGRTLGALTLAASVSGRHFSLHDLEFAETVARRAALAVDNARLYSGAQQAARAREEVLAFVSHDLRNPLATILLNASSLMELIPEERLLPEEREQLDWIARSSEQMNRLIQDLLDVARIEAGRLPIRPVPLPVESLFREARYLLQPLASEKGVSLVCECAAPGLKARYDRERLQRVLSNLGGNSIKFTAPGGQIRITAEQDGGTVRVAVADTGCGIAIEDRPHIFERYWQGRASGLRGEAGNGLGLAIAKGIVEAHGGRIWFDSTVDEGTTFYFTIPSVDSADIAWLEEIGEAPDPGHGRPPQAVRQSPHSDGSG